MNQIKFSLTILSLIFSINTVAQNKVAVIPLIENAPPSNTVYVKSNGQNIGVFVDEGYWVANGSARYSTFSMKEYFFTVSSQTGSVGEESLHYTSTNCTGTPFLYIYENQLAGVNTFTASNGQVFSGGNPSATYYVPKGAQSVLMHSNSYIDYNSTVCTSHDAGIVNAYTVLPNDPTITGVQNSYSLPVSAGF